MVSLPSHTSRATWTHHCSMVCHCHPTAAATWTHHCSVVVCHCHPTAAEQHGHITVQWCAIAISPTAAEQHGHITVQWCAIAIPQQQSNMDTSLFSGVPLPSHSSRAAWTHHCSVVCHCLPTAAEQHGHITVQWCAISIPQQQQHGHITVQWCAIAIPQQQSNMDTSLNSGVSLPSHSSRATWTHHCSVVCHFHPTAAAIWTHHCSVVCHFHPTAAEQHGHITVQWCAISIPQQQSSMDTSLNSGVPFPSHSSRATWTHHCSVVCHCHPTAAEQHGHITEQWCVIAISPTAAATWTHHYSVVCHCHPTTAEQHGHITEQWCVIAFPQQQSNMDTSLFSGVPLPSHSSRAAWTHHCSVVCHCHPTAAEQHGHITEQWCVIAFPQQQSNMDTSLSSGGVPFPSHSSSNMDTSLFSGVPLPSHSSRAAWTHHCSVVCHCHPTAAATWTHHCSKVCHCHPTAAEQHGHITEQWCVIAFPQQQSNMDTSLSSGGVPFPSHSSSNMDTSLFSGVPLPSHTSRAAWTHHCSMVCHCHQSHSSRAIWTHH